MTIFLTHSKVKLALHTLRRCEGPALLILHELGGSAPQDVPEALKEWPGPVYALDFTGHGQSSIPAGGGYTAEVLMGDADLALGYIGPATVIGNGLGAYIALMIAGGRPRVVQGAILCDGRGLTGGGTEPRVVDVRGVTEQHATPDPFALLELSEDLRPPDYAAAFARIAAEHSALETPISVCAMSRPEWLAAVLDERGVASCQLDEAIRRYGEIAIR